MRGGALPRRLRPLVNGFRVDDHVVSALPFFGLGAFGAGRILGLDPSIETTARIEINRWLPLFQG